MVFNVGLHVNIETLRFLKVDLDSPESPLIVQTVSKLRDNVKYLISSQTVRGRDFGRTRLIATPGYLCNGGLSGQQQQKPGV